MSARTLIFATANPNKIIEVSEILDGEKYGIKSMSEMGFNGDIEETGSTLKENAFIKADFIHNQFNLDCFSEDTGLEIDFLNGEPGVRTARFAGEQKNAEDNMNLVLEKLGQTENRSARFRTIFCLILDQEVHYFEGICEGKIDFQKSGDGGFGYDPIFVPDGYSKSFAELDSSIKNRISHRALAFEKLTNFLK